ncbi:MAG: NAD(P)H-dependent oxidoreductase [Anaerolineae bacterium]|nr:NAD(P)H-dependent oxidoreductase [Anaerolineae bacterium]
MNIGIIVHSHTGHTLAVAKELQKALSAAGHAVTLAQVEPAGPVSSSATRAELKTRPAIDAYDALVFGSPVWGGRMSAPMNSYLEQIASLQGKKVACLVTNFFVRGWGGDQTLKLMQEACAAKGATVCGLESVRWFSLSRKRRIAQVVDSLSKLF